MGPANPSVRRGRISNGRSLGARGMTLNPPYAGSRAWRAPEQVARSRSRRPGRFGTRSLPRGRYDVFQTGRGARRRRDERSVSPGQHAQALRQCIVHLQQRGF